MEIKKFKHACVVLTKHSQSLVIDPGEWSTDFIPPENVVAVVVTHEHGDHFSLEHIASIMSKNPAAKIFVPKDLIERLKGFATAIDVSGGQIIQVGDFTISFFGEQHATIHPDYPVCNNVGVLVDGGEFYYPGDSFTLPASKVKLLAVPAAAPWMKIAEAMDFVAAVQPEEFFAVHDAVLSPEGKMVADAWFARTAEKTGSVYKKS